jgi:hypothetical protein
MIEEGRTGLVQWAAASSPMPGQLETGDAQLVLDEDESVLLAVIDGLGHGPDAARAALAAKEAVAKHSQKEVSALVTSVHGVLRGTRGVAMSVARLDGRTDKLAWVGVGNVEASLFSGRAPPKREVLGARGGVVGYSLPRLAARVLPVARGDTVIIATDGMRGWSAAGAIPHGAPRDAAEELHRRFAKPNDDSLVLVAKYWGRGA